MLSFKAHCARNHDRIDFTDPQSFESHMATEHGKRKLTVGGRHTYSGKTAPLKPGVKPYPWTAPKPERNGLAKVTERITAGEYVWPESEWSFRPAQPAAEATEAA